MAEGDNTGHAAGQPEGPLHPQLTKQPLKETSGLASASSSSSPLSEPAEPYELPIEEQGQLIAGDAEGLAALLSVGEPGQVLTVDPGAPLGVSWQGPFDPPEGNEGEEVPADLAKWISVGLQVSSTPDDNVPEISQDYSPPAGTELLVVVWFNNTNASLKSGVTVSNNGEPDYSQSQQSLAGSTIFGMQIWKNPVAGVISRKLEPNTMEFTFCAISVKAQGGEPLRRQDTDGEASVSEAKPKTMEDQLDLQFPGLVIAATQAFNQGAKPFSEEHPGTRILKIQDDTAGSSGQRGMEICCALYGSGVDQAVKWKWAEGSAQGICSCSITEEEA